MKALVYRNTQTLIPRCAPMHAEFPRGMAYETDTHFVHIYGYDTGLWIVSPGLTVTEKKSGNLSEWTNEYSGR